MVTSETPKSLARPETLSRPSSASFARIALSRSVRSTTIAGPFCSLTKLFRKSYDTSSFSDVKKQ